MSEPSLLTLAAAGEWPEMKALLRTLSLRQRRAAVRAREADGDTALHYVCRGSFEDEAGRARLVRDLIAAGADVDAWSDQIVPPIAAAVFGGARSTVRVLVQAGARLAIESRAGVPLLYVAAEAWTRAGQAGLEGNAPSRAAGRALQQRLLGIARDLIAAGIDLNARTRQYRQTALIGAIDRGAKPMIDLLLRTRGIDLDARDHLGLTALHYAAHTGNRALARKLLRAGAQPDLQDRYGFTPLHEAAANGHTGLFRDLVQAGASPRKRLRIDFGPFPRGATPADVARLSGH
jgi:ankyrin repeat protein